MSSELKEGEDFYYNENNQMVFTEKYHLKRGFCCESGCKHCPFGFNNLDPNIPRELIDPYDDQ